MLHVAYHAVMFSHHCLSYLYIWNGMCNLNVYCWRLCVLINKVKPSSPSYNQLAWHNSIISRCHLVHKQHTTQIPQNSISNVMVPVQGLPLSLPYSLSSYTHLVKHAQDGTSYVRVDPDNNTCRCIPTMTYVQCQIIVQ